MGGVFNADSENPNKWWFHPQPTPYYRKDAMHLTVGLRYDSDWNWLMPVVEKIESINYSSVQIKEGLCHISYHDTNGYWNHKKIDGHPKIISTHKAVIEFIKWYNSQQSKLDEVRELIKK